MKVALLLLLPVACYASSFALKQCAGHFCGGDAKYPILDHDGKNCLCTQHPCHNDDGSVHGCSDRNLPFLRFSYSAQGRLQCDCGKAPHVGSVSVAQNHCRGQTCASEDAPVLDYVGGKCVCAAHPCWADNGMKHSCVTGEKPVLDFTYHSDGSLNCFCRAKFELPKDEF